MSGPLFSRTQWLRRSVYFRAMGYRAALARRLTARPVLGSQTAVGFKPKAWRKLRIWLITEFSRPFVPYARRARPLGNSGRLAPARGNVIAGMKENVYQTLATF